MSKKINIGNKHHNTPPKEILIYKPMPSHLRYGKIKVQTGKHDVSLCIDLEI